MLWYWEIMDVETDNFLFCLAVVNHFPLWYQDFFEITHYFPNVIISLVFCKGESISDHSFITLAKVISHLASVPRIFDSSGDYLVFAILATISDKV